MYYLTATCWYSNVLWGGQVTENTNLLMSEAYYTGIAQVDNRKLELEYQ